MPSLGLVDYGAGNFASVYNALDYLGLSPCAVKEPRELEAATHVILPGVGTFAATMEKLSRCGMSEALREQVLERGKPFLGICVGMQVLADEGEEFGTCQGLGFIPGKVRQLDVAAHGLPLPHMGWNQLQIKGDCPLFARMPADPSFYFVHSFHFVPTEPSAAVAACEYGQSVAACVARDNLFGVQFHPEKSQRDGLALLKNFSRL